MTSSPFLSNATTWSSLKSFIESHSALVDKLLRSFYVDDLVTGADTKKQAFLLYSDAVADLRGGGLGGKAIDIRVNERDWKLPYLYIDFVYH